MCSLICQVAIWFYFIDAKFYLINFDCLSEEWYDKTYNVLLWIWIITGPCAIAAYFDKITKLEKLGYQDF